MNTALLIASLVSSAVIPGTIVDKPDDRNDRFVDRSTVVRAFHAEAMVAMGGSFAMEMVPVQAQGQRAFLLSDSYADPKAPMEAGEGWMFVRDAMGNGAMVLISEDMSLYDLEDALDGAPSLEAEFAVALDRDGAHLVGVLDSHGQTAFERDVLHYRPAPSVSTEAAAQFLPRGSMVWPERSFSADSEDWSLDKEAQWGSSQGYGLRISQGEQDEIQAAELPDTRGWKPFLSLAEPVHTLAGWALSMPGDVNSAVAEMGADFGRGWGQRAFDLRFMGDEGTWETVSGPMADIQAQIPVDLSDYGIQARPSGK
ncbi:MAG: hypothetical protein CL927_20110 [Deltaproteobacteria bacterium]|nr:hypothetical protein [Deltaproteobacteria bacterium]HCH66158.1 hypothetical protein [Deltaproteobacteria bacterium]